MAPKFGDLKRYCDKNGWVMLRNTDHWYFPSQSGMDYRGSCSSSYTVSGFPGRFARDASYLPPEQKQVTSS